MKEKKTRWSETDKKQLKKLANANTPTRLIAWKLKRSVSAIYSKSVKMGQSLQPVNQSPYNRLKK